MNLFKTISRLKWASIFALIKLCLNNVLMLWPTYKATKECMQISTEHFGRKHYQNGQANAFRHALWNILIAKKCIRYVKNLRSVLQWTKNITDWHEAAFFSKKLPMLMDYHNNEVGRILFSENENWTKEQFMEFLLTLVPDAIKITINTDLNTIKKELVYITNDH